MELSKIEPNYILLAAVLQQAYLRASAGKGKERHATGESFEQQPICTELRKMGLGPAIFQIRKKALELLRFRGIKGKQRRTNELLDIIVYASAAVIVNEEESDGRKKTSTVSM